MVIQLNGEPHTLPDGATAADLVESLQLTGKRIAMEVNLEILPRSSYAEHRLNGGDRVEIVHAIGGGSR
jgi:sulfur carrier protein